MDAVSVHTPNVTSNRDLTIKPRNSDGKGYSVFLSGGDSNDASGGDMELRGGTGPDGSGAVITLDGAASGGNATVAGGNAAAGAAGDVILRTGTGGSAAGIVIMDTLTVDASTVTMDLSGLTVIDVSVGTITVTDISVSTLTVSDLSEEQPPSNVVISGSNERSTIHKGRAHGILDGCSGGCLRVAVA